MSLAQRSNSSTLTTEELAAMHWYCCKYRDTVRAGKKPQAEQDKRFLRYQRICYQTGVAYERV